jgi:hypothetical protein
LRGAAGRWQAPPLAHDRRQGLWSKNATTILGGYENDYGAIFRIGLFHSREWADKITEAGRASEVPSGMSVSGCLDCDRLQQVALMASRTYYELLGDLEAAHILHNSDPVQRLSVLRKKALQIRDAAIAELTIHENAHVHKTAEGRQQLRKRQSA